MPSAPELVFQQLSTVAGVLDQKPVTVTAAATISPTTFLTLVTGTTAVTTITPPILGAHLLAFQVSTTNFGGFATTGNVAFASLTNSTFWVGKLVLMTYNPLVNKYYPLYPGPVAATNA